MAERIIMKMYKCDYCGELFDRLNKCTSHELIEHKCPTCIHSYYVYGCELKCYRSDKHKLCKFQKKSENN